MPTPPSSSLPPAPSPTATCTLTLLPAGRIHLQSSHFVSDPIPSDPPTLHCPSMSWLLHHPATNTRLLFDLGLRKDSQNYIPPIAERIRTRVSIDVVEDVYDGLKKAGLDAQKDIDVVIFSHLHYDHVGDPGGFGAGTKFVIGPGAAGLLGDGPRTWPGDEGSIFDSGLLAGRAEGRVVELPAPAPEDPEEEEKKKEAFWKPLGPFPYAHDYFGDGSVFIINAPGHLLGHINLLVRVGLEKWMYLAGDTAHDVRVYRGTRELAVYPDPKSGRMVCAHGDQEAAHEHMLRVRRFEEDEGGRVEVVLAHDYEWAERFGGLWGVKG
ncbi:hypothetical protein FQN53_006718 [Emmonsiellopsis sp. PD_33]|nr:hypothetical protein FQN53_006718 [Emmonsiellopsis sp. PD_33]